MNDAAAVGLSGADNKVVVGDNDDGDDDKGNAVTKSDA